MMKLKSERKPERENQKNIFSFFIILTFFLVSCRLLVVKKEKDMLGDKEGWDTLAKHEQSESKKAIKEKASKNTLRTNDPSIQKKWGLSQIDAHRAWSLSKGSHGVVVAVIDTGADLRHEDLKQNLWINPGEKGLDSLGRDKKTNGVDDDKNGYIDDVYGWNFVHYNGDVKDHHGHGTHIAGIIGAVRNNGKGISGVAPNIQLMILKYYESGVPTDHLKNTVRAIHYAIEMGADIINYSGGGMSFSQEEREAILKAQRRGILFVAAAGNESSDADDAKSHYYPASYNLSNIISVAAIDSNEKMVSSSNWGVRNVDVAAPGRKILSTLPLNSYGYMTGTSQATAYVSGAAALIMDRKKYKQAIKVKKHILSTGDPIQSLYGRVKTAKRLNLFKALALSDRDESLGGGSVLLNAPKKNSIYKSERSLSFLNKLFVNGVSLPTTLNGATSESVKNMGIDIDIETR